MINNISLIWFEKDCATCLQLNYDHINALICIYYDTVFTIEQF